jgi:ApbE superfamily uncharacterized protein (UPF0280 family)
LSDQKTAISVAIESFLANRERLDDYIRIHQDYEFSLIPMRVEASAPRVVRMAAEASEIAEVGPMAAIPGALADLAREDMMATGASVCLVENGGEISVRSNRPMKVGVYAGRTGLSGRFGFLLEPEDLPLGVSTSSATVSHALNFGESDATVIFANNAAAADAAATAISNAVSGKDVEASVQNGLETSRKIGGVRGALIIRGECIGTAGMLPKIFRVEGSLGELFEADLYDTTPVES